MDNQLTIPKELNSKVVQLKNAIGELSTFLEQKSMGCYFNPLLLQLDQLSSEVSGRLDEISTFYIFLNTHNVSNSSTSCGYFSILPDELLIKVFSFLNQNQLLRISAVNQQWKRLSEDESLWRRLYFRRWKDKKKKNPQTVVFMNSVNHLSSQNHHETNGIKKSKTQIDWKATYVRKKHIETNWKLNRHTVQTHPGHTSTRVRCLQFDEDKLVMGSFDQKSIKVLDFKTRKSITDLVGHVGGVMSLKFHGNILLSASRDRTVKMWDMMTGVCINTFTEHGASVWCLDWDGNGLAVSGSEDRLVKMWDLKSGKCIDTFAGHSKGIGSITFDDKIIGSGSRDKSIRMWDLRNKSCLHILKGHTNSVRCLKFDDVRVVSGSWDNTIKIWDITTGELIGDLEGHTDRVLTLQFDNDKIVSGSFDKTIKIWSLETNKCMHTLEGHGSPLAYVHFDECRIVSSSRDLTIKVWDYS